MNLLCYDVIVVTVIFSENFSSAICDFDPELVQAPPRSPGSSQKMHLENFSKRRVLRRTRSAEGTARHGTARYSTVTRVVAVVVCLTCLQRLVLLIFLCGH